MNGGIEPGNQTDLRHALNLCDIGVEQMASGAVKMALDTFNESLRAHPTAEGYTYRGWAISFMGNYEQAIAECRRAIDLDPEFGNPYNDIGVYLMNLGKLDEALVWLKRAKAAKRYRTRHFPFLNMGHVFTIQGEQDLALQEYVLALELDPDNAIAKKAIANMPWRA